MTRSKNIHVVRNRDSSSMQVYSKGDSESHYSPILRSTWFYTAHRPIKYQHIYIVYYTMIDGIKW